MYENKIYEFNVTPFGLKTSTAALIRDLDGTISDFQKFIVNFVDDLVCKSSNVHEHLKHLELLFKRFRENGLTLNFNKCKFFKKEIKFLGHIISNEGIRIDPDKIQTIKDFPQPKNLKQLQSFLGFINFYSKFTDKHAQTTQPLYNLLKKKHSMVMAN